MSIQAVSWVLENSESRLGDRLVLLSIANHANHKTGEAWPSVETLAVESRMSHRQVQRALKRLAQDNELEIRKNTGPRGTHRYRILGMTNCHPPSGVEGVTNRGDKLSGGVTNRVENMSDLSPEPSGTVKKKEDPPCPPADLDLVAWEQWEAYRKAIRKPIKPVSVPAAQRKLAGFGELQGAVVEQSIANGWTGLFALKDGDGTSRKNSKPGRFEQSTEHIRAWASG